jgi:hypothetical protein
MISILRKVKARKKLWLSNYRKQQRDNTLQMNKKTTGHMQKSGQLHLGKKENRK